MEATNAKIMTTTSTRATARVLLFNVFHKCLL